MREIGSGLVLNIHVLLIHACRAQGFSQGEGVLDSGFISAFCSAWQLKMKRIQKVIEAPATRLLVNSNIHDELGKKRALFYILTVMRSEIFITRARYYYFIYCVRGDEDDKIFNYLPNGSKENTSTAEQKAANHQEWIYAILKTCFGDYGLEFE